MTAQKTRCPFCESVFAVTAEQLAARGGHVRCGKCFQVFKADDQLVNEEAAQQQPQSEDVLFDYLDQSAQKDSANKDDVTWAGQAPVANNPPPVDHSQHQADALERPTDMDDDFEGLFSSLAPVEIDPNENFAQRGLTPQDVADTITAPEPIKPAASIEPIAATISTSQSMPASPATIQALFNDDPIADRTVKPKMMGGLKLDSEFSDMFLGDKSREMDALKRDELTSVDKLHAAADESWVEDLLKDDPVPVAASMHQPAAAAKKPTTPVPQAKSQKQPVNTKIALPPSEIAEDIPVGEQLAGSSTRTPTSDDEDLLSYLSRTGVASGDDVNHAPAAVKPRKGQQHAAPMPASHRVLKPTKQSFSPAYFISWGLMCLLMLVLLIGQYLYFSFDRLASDPQHYAQMRKLCAIVGCRVPLIDIDLIKTSKIKAQRSPNNRAHTRFSLTLTNTATETQPMPPLKLLLLKDGEVTAGQVIRPADYLTGALAGLNRMPPNTPIKVSFDINITRSKVGTFAIDPSF
jgi:predicted Zn finger-like uncharacterized protein